MMTDQTDKKSMLDAALHNAFLAKEHSSFYKRHLADVSNGTCFENLPFTDGRLLAKNGISMLQKSQSDIVRIRSFRTSGSTGNPKRMYFDQGDLKRCKAFFAAGMEGIADETLPTLILMSDDKPASMASLLKEALLETGKESIIFGRPQGRITTELLAELRHAGCIIGLPADILYLSAVCDYLRPTSVLLSGDYIPLPVIRRIKDAWKCPVYIHYGMTETCYGLAVSEDVTISDYTDYSMAVRYDDFYLEVIHPLSGKPLPEGSIGELVITSLKISALPLIRYRTGDIGSLKRDGRRLGRILGRTAVFFDSPNIHHLDDILFAEEDVIGFFAKKRGDSLLLSIETKTGAPLQNEPRLAEAIGTLVSFTYCFAPPWCINSNALSANAKRTIL